MKTEKEAGSRKCWWKGKKNKIKEDKDEEKEKDPQGTEDGGEKKVTKMILK